MQSIENFKNELKNKENIIQEMKYDIDGQTHAKNDQNTINDSLRKEIQDCKNKLVEASNLQNLSTIKNETLIKENNSSNDKQHEQKDKHTLLEAHFDQLKHKQAESQKTLSEYNMKIKNDEAEIENLNQMLNEAKTEVKVAAQNVSTNDNEITILGQEMDEITGKCEMLEEDLNQEKCAALELMQEVQAVEGEKDRVLVELTSVKSQLNNEMSANSKFLLQISDMETENDEIKEQFDYEKQKAENAKKEADKFKKDRSQWQMKYEAERKITMETQNKILNIETENRDLKKQLESFKSNQNELKDKKEVVATSIMQGLLGKSVGNRPIRRSVTGAENKSQRSSQIIGGTEKCMFSELKESNKNPMAQSMFHDNSMPNMNNTGLFSKKKPNESQDQK